MAKAKVNAIGHKFQKGDKPTHQLKFLNKTTEERGQLGVGWQKPDGSISIRLNPMTVIRVTPDLVITLFPIGAPSPDGEDADETCRDNPF